MFKGSKACKENIPQCSTTSLNFSYKAGCIHAFVYLAAEIKTRRTTQCFYNLLQYSFVQFRWVVYLVSYLLTGREPNVVICCCSLSMCSAFHYNFLHTSVVSIVWVTVVLSAWTLLSITLPPSTMLTRSLLPSNQWLADLYTCVDEHGNTLT